MRTGTQGQVVLKSIQSIWLDFTSQFRCRIGRIFSKVSKSLQVKTSLQESYIGHTLDAKLIPIHSQYCSRLHTNPR